MKDFLLQNQREILWTFLFILVLLFVRFATNKTVRRIGEINEFVEARILLIKKYASFLFLFLTLGAIFFIWGINIKDIGLLFSSVFTIIGVALFAQWSILSNITSGVILFFSFPFKIGDSIKIMDKEIMDNSDDGNNIFVIEDIKAFHVHLRKDNGELLTYPNNLMLQKAISLINDIKTP